MLEQRPSVGFPRVLLRAAFYTGEKRALLQPYRAQAFPRRQAPLSLAGKKEGKKGEKGTASPTPQV